LFGDGLAGTIVSRDGDELVIEFNKPELIEDVGLPPVPPYIRARRSAAAEPAVTGVLDKDRYQTIYARHTGSAAAPTAGLHFTERLLKEIISAGADIAHVTLHVGLDTFSPVRTEDILKHKMHGEGYFVPDDTVAAIERTRSNGGRVIAVGTTSVRALESHPPLKKGGRGGFTELFITPGYKFRVVDVILTNFHQPRSTLLMLVSAFAGREFILRAYKEAIKERYRLFSYGDCMLIM
jgi:S-adenosylmethionine:tRNA ribosyltransferase-isomerase